MTILIAASTVMLGSTSGGGSGSAAFSMVASGLAALNNTGYARATAGSIFPDAAINERPIQRIYQRDIALHSFSFALIQTGAGAGLPIDFWDQIDISGPMAPIPLAVNLHTYLSANATSHTQDFLLSGNYLTVWGFDPPVDGRYLSSGETYDIDISWTV